MQIASGQLIYHTVTVGKTTSGDNTVATAVSGKRLQVVALVLVVGAAENIYFRSGTTNTDLLGSSTVKIQLVANSGFVLPFNPAGWGEQAETGETIEMNLASGSDVAGSITYAERDP